MLTRNLEIVKKNIISEQYSIVHENTSSKSLYLRINPRKNIYGSTGTIITMQHDIILL